MEKYTPPAYKSDGFNCPSCGAFSRQVWPTVVKAPGGSVLRNVAVSICDRCSQEAAWYNRQLVHPRETPMEPASEDMPPVVAADYEEARRVFAASARSSAALLRLAVQKLCIELGQPGKNLNDDIGSLVKLGLPDRAQKALDIVRVIGNNQVHPGTIDVRDDSGIATTLFGLVNLIVETLITTPKKIDPVFNALPDGAKKQIAQRDSKTNATP